MKNVGFIGAFDKIDLILIVAKIATLTGKKVLVIDSTLNQKARYVVPVINPTKSYITEYEGIDVAVGFENYDEISKYVGLSDPNPQGYDLALVDIDSARVLDAFTNAETIKNYFVTSFDLFSLKKGLEIISEIKEPMNLTKILFSKSLLKEEDEYLNFLSLGYKVIWENYHFAFPFETGDQSVLMENQRVSKIKIKKLSEQYKEGVLCIIDEILTDVSSGDMKKAFKLMEREG